VSCTPRSTSFVVPPARKLCPATSLLGRSALSLCMNHFFVAGPPFAFMNNVIFPGAYFGSVLRMIYSLSMQMGHNSSLVELIIRVGRSVVLWFLVLGS
ncbi:9991_t:CDS:1, partial [Cetraspora pellucida]